MEVVRKKRIGETHFQNRIWRNELAFYREELKIFQERLEEASKNPSQEAHIGIEQFQNKFLIQRVEIDKLEHLININEDKAVAAGEIHLQRIDYEATEEFIDIKNSMTTFVKLYNDLKKDFYNFLCKWM